MMLLRSEALLLCFSEEEGYNVREGHLRRKALGMQVQWLLLAMYKADRCDLLQRQTEEAN